MNSWKNQIVVKTLVPFVAAYLIICILRSQAANLEELSKNWQSLLGIGALSFALALFQDLFPKSWKEILVFWRVRERLPGYRAFCPETKFGDMIDRAEIVDIERRELLTPKEQDRVYFRLYNKFRDVGSVSNSSYRYLQWRELAFLALVSSLAVLATYIQKRGFSSPLPWELACYGLVVMLLSIVAARKSAKDLLGFVLLNELLEQQGDGGD